MVQIEVKVNYNSLEAGFRNKGAQVNSRIDKLSKDITDVVHRWVQAEAPRKTGKTKASVKKQNFGSRGIVFVSKSVAPHVFIVLEGSRPHKIVAKHKRALKVPGWGVFKSVNHPGTKPNPFVDRGAQKSQGEINHKIAAFEQWLVEV